MPIKPKDKTPPGAEGATTQVDVGAMQQLLEPQTSLLIYHRHGTTLAGLAEGQQAIIGRTAPSEIVIADDSLSREHCRFVLSKGIVRVDDLGSTNGTWINGKRIKPGVGRPVRAGDEVRLGAVTVALHALATGESGELATLDGHDALVERLDEEMLRGRTFGRSLTLLQVRAGKHKKSHLSNWYPKVREHLRAVDRAALYGPDSLLLLLPEADAAEGQRLAETFTSRERGSAPLFVGIATFPQSGASVDELMEAARVACQQANNRAPVQLAGDDPTTQPRAVVATSAAMVELFATARRVADTVVPVLIAGETGTGKEVLARAIHDASPRADAPMRCLNCGAIPQQLVESTLFGHERGSFTGADRQVAGIFEETKGGTVLLDEIGELPPQAQTALLRVLETRKVTRIGSSQEIDVDVRVIAATNRDLEEMAGRGAFRTDLLYRLNAITLKVPPLRERGEDIEALATRFVSDAAAATGRPVKAIEPAALDLLKRYSWPGNVRELRNVIERAVVLARDDRITVGDLSDRLRGTSTPTRASEDGEAQSIKDKLRLYEAELIVEALGAHDWNQTRTAKALGISRRSLVEKIRTYGIKKRYG